MECFACFFIKKKKPHDASHRAFVAGPELDAILQSVSVYELQRAIEQLFDRLIRVRGQRSPPVCFELAG